MADASGITPSGRSTGGRGRAREQNASDPAPSASSTEAIDRLLVEAVAAQASDLHIEPLPNGNVRIRVRIDGEMLDHATVRRTVDGQVRMITPFPVEDKRSVSNLRGRISSMAGFDLDEYEPKDGAFDPDKSPVKARVAISPTVDGVLMVLRLFPEGELVKLEWASPRDEAVWADATTSGRAGLALVVGPTGAGKSTVVFNTLEELVGDGKAVSTIEDPVEYRLPGARQAEVSARADFDAILKGLARVDSDVIFVGELRDKETVATVITAANRGRTVFSTLHALDAASAPSSLESLGVDMLKLANVLAVVVAQRLLRRTCTECAGTGADDSDNVCGLCQGSGYYGRVAVREVIEMTEGMRELIRSGASPAKIRDLAMREGMQPMRWYADRLVNDGVTTPDEAKGKVG